MIFLVSILFPIFAHSDECLVWFKNSKIKKDKDCVLKCVSIQVDMGTFDCPSKCGKLCSTKNEQSYLPNNSNKQIGLTE